MFSALRLQIVLLHGQAFTSKTWEELGTLSLLATHGYQAFALDLPGTTRTLHSQLLFTFLHYLLSCFVYLCPGLSWPAVVPYCNTCLNRSVFLNSVGSNRCLCFSRIWEHSRLRDGEDRPKPRWAAENVLGVAWGAHCSSHQPLYEWALFHALSHEAQHTVAWVCAHCPSWHPQSLCTAISGHPGELCQLASEHMVEYLTFLQECHFWKRLV